MSAWWLNLRRAAPSWRSQTLGWVALALFGAGNVGAADFFTGAELLDICASERLFAQTRCEGYLGGIADAYVAMASVDKRPQLGGCIPEGVSARMMREAFVEWSKDYRSELQKPAIWVAWAALGTRWPCQSLQ